MLFFDVGHDLGSASTMITDAGARDGQLRVPSIMITVSNRIQYVRADSQSPDIATFLCGIFRFGFDRF